MLNKKELELTIKGMCNTATNPDLKLNYDSRKGIFAVAQGLNKTLQQRFKSFKGFTIQEIASMCDVQLKEEFRK
jgi:hypothetical protein